MVRSDDALQWPYPPALTKRLENCLSFGNTGIIELLPDGDKVKKSPHPFASSRCKEYMRKQLKRELEVYQRLPNTHNRVIHMFGYSDDDDGYLVLEYMRNGSLRAHLESEAEIAIPQRLRWCVEAAEALVLLHTHGVIHADFKPENMLLDDRLSLRIIDLSGASIDEKPPLSLESTRFYLPRSMKDPMPCSVTTDLFALGSSLYQIMTRKQPYEDLPDEEVESKFARKDFPSVDGIPYGDTIRTCWFCEFETAEAVLNALKTEMKYQMTRLE